jgi:RNA polymerase sigma-70 factor (ECF subfamily)
MLTSTHEEFARLFVLNQRRIYGYIMTLLPNQADAEDVFQQTSLLLWKKWDQFDQSGDFVRWACGLARNEVRNFVRLRRHRDVFFTQEMLEELSQLQLSIDYAQEEQRDALTKCLEQLPVRQRELVESCYRGSQSLKAFAGDSRITPSALYMKLHRIRQLLLKCIQMAVGQEGA